MCSLAWQTTAVDVNASTQHGSCKGNMTTPDPEVSSPSEW